MAELVFHGMVILVVERCYIRSVKGAQISGGEDMKGRKSADLRGIIGHG